jgi:ribosomal protein S27AE
MVDSTGHRKRVTSPHICPRCGGALIAGTAESEPICLNCGYVAFASGLTPQAAEAELSNRPSLPVATDRDSWHRADWP